MSGRENGKCPAERMANVRSRGNWTLWRLRPELAELGLIAAVLVQPTPTSGRAREADVLHVEEP